MYNSKPRKQESYKEPREYTVKTAELFRNQKPEEEKQSPAPELDRLRVGVR